MAATARPNEADRDDERRERDKLSALLGGSVLRLLGEPGGLHRVQVRALWEGRYRVNVLVGADAASAKVAHSFFLVADPDGNILASSPEITRRY
jgi:hypothetical protein